MINFWPIIVVKNLSQHIFRTLIHYNIYTFKEYKNTVEASEVKCGQKQDIEKKKDIFISCVNIIIQHVIS